MRIFWKPVAATTAVLTVAALVAGCGSSSIPSNSVASVAGNPITLSAVNHWMYVVAKEQAAQYAAQGETSPVITAPDPNGFSSCIKQIREQVPSYATDSTAMLRSLCREVFNQQVSEVLGYLVQSYWFQADAHKLGIVYTAVAQAKALGGVTKQFKTHAAYLTYLASAGETEADVDFQLHVSGVYNKLLAHFEKPVTSAQVVAYYKAHKSEFTTSATVSGHLIRVKTQSNAAGAVADLQAGSSWAQVAKKYAEDAASRSDGGLITSVTPSTYEAAVNNKLFTVALNKVVGPINGVFGHYVIEVSKRTPQVVKSLAQEKSEIKTLIRQSAQTAAASKITAYSKKLWGSSTLCRAPYEVSYCTNYVAPKTTTVTSPTSTTSTTGTTSSTTSSTKSTTSSTTSSIGTGTTGTSTKNNG
ncbi:MAG: peptidyl-prolyl cis-trans isomerase [Solirubrobacteraceae bacterium]